MRQPALFGFDLRFSTSSGVVDAAADGPEFRRQNDDDADESKRQGLGR
jgi:hypothetical protein